MYIDVHTRIGREKHMWTCMYVRMFVQTRDAYAWEHWTTWVMCVQTCMYAYARRACHACKYILIVCAFFRSFSMEMNDMMDWWQSMVILCFRMLSGRTNNSPRASSSSSRVSAFSTRASWKESWATSNRLFGFMPWRKAIQPMIRIWLLDDQALKNSRLLHAYAQLDPIIAESLCCKRNIWDFQL